MQPDPGQELAFVTDSQQLSQMNWTPVDEDREKEKKKGFSESMQLEHLT